MPTRTCNGAAATVSSPATASTSVSAVRTARSASCSSAARITEIGQHAVAHVLGDKPAVAPDHLGAAAVIGADHLAQILRIEPRRQRRRADQIAEHHRKLAPLGRRSRAGCDRPRLHGGLGAQRGDRLQKLAPMASKYHPEILEVLRRELRQRVRNRSRYHGTPGRNAQDQGRAAIPLRPCGDPRLRGAATPHGRR